MAATIYIDYTELILEWKYPHNLIGSDVFVKHNISNFIHYQECDFSEKTPQLQLYVTSLRQQLIQFFQTLPTLFRTPAPDEGNSRITIDIYSSTGLYLNL